MREVQFRVPKQCDLEAAEELIDQICAERGLVISMKGSLAGYPGCTHWHYKKQDQRGTLELTLYPQERRIWAQVQDGRRAPWIDLELPGLQRAIEAGLRQGLIRATRRTKPGTKFSSRC